MRRNHFLFLFSWQYMYIGHFYSKNNICKSAAFQVALGIFLDLLERAKHTLLSFGQTRGTPPWLVVLGLRLAAPSFTLICSSTSLHFSAPGLSLILNDNWLFDLFNWDLHGANYRRFTIPKSIFSVSLYVVISGFRDLRSVVIDLY